MGWKSGKIYKEMCLNWEMKCEGRWEHTTEKCNQGIALWRMIMRLLWITNIKVECGDNETCRGGWMTGALNYLLDNTDCEIIIAYPNGKNNFDNFNIKYVPFFYDLSRTKYDENLYNQFLNIYAEYQPDIIHIWGTEYLHTYAAVKAAEKMQLIDKLIIHIQGLVSVYSKHYALGIPERHQKAKTLLDIITGSSLKNQIKTFQKRGINERLALKSTQYVIGRTSWDKACVEQINPGIKYLFSNEIMRPLFYSAEKWEQSKCERHTIFISQANRSIKGFHFVVEALNIIKRHYLNVKVYVAGGSIFDKKGEMSFINRHLRINTYNKYLYQKICRYDLQENIVFLGTLSAAQMKENYLRANVFVSASTIENSCNSVIEAMLLGVPVVSSYVGGITDMIVHKKDGILYPCDEPYMLAYYIMELFKDTNLAEQISVNARQKAMKEYDQATIGKELISIYKSL